MSLKDRLNLNTQNESSQSGLMTAELPKENLFYNDIFEKLLSENNNIIVCSSIDIPTYNALNFVCSKIPNDKRLVGIGANLLLNPSEIIKFEPDIKNVSKELIKTALSLNPFKIILQDFDGVEAVDIFKMINSNIKNIISAVNAQSPQKALRQIELNLYMNGVQIPEPLMKEMLTEFVDNIVVVEQAGNSYFISKIYTVQSLSNNEYVISDVLKKPSKAVKTENNIKAENEQKIKESPVKKAIEKKNKIKEEEPPKKRNILAEKFKRKKITKQA